MSVIKKLVTRAQQSASGKAILLPEWHDERMLLAANQVARQGIAIPVLPGQQDDIEQRCQQLGITSAGIGIQPVEKKIDHFMDVLKTKFAPKLELSTDKAQQLANDPLYQSALLLDGGEADGMVAGISRSTADVVRAALKVVGLQKSSRTASSFFLVSMAQPWHPLPLDCVFADCALVIDPSQDQLADIALASAKSAQQFLETEAKIAMLSFSTSGSANHERVTKVQQATAQVQAQRPDLQIIGEVQMDAALIPEVARVKLSSTPFTPPANVFIFPSLEAGNIGYKLCQRLAGADVVGPVLQGFNKPVNDLSRGATVDEIVRLIALTALQSTS